LREHLLAAEPGKAQEVCLRFWRSAAADCRQRLIDAGRLLEEIAWFAPQLRTCLLPDWETLPYDSFSPHEDLISERLATLWRIRRGEVDVVLMPATTALVRLAPPSFIAGYTFHFTTKQRLDEAALIARPWLDVRIESAHVWGLTGTLRGIAERFDAVAEPVAAPSLDLIAAN